MSGFDKDKSEYYRAGRKYEAIDVIRDWGLNFNLGNVVKYISRDGRKESDNGVDNLKKALDYLSHEIQYREGELKRNEDIKSQLQSLDNDIAMLKSHLESRRNNDL